MVDTKMVVAENILAILKQQNKKQTELADALHTNRQTINKMLNGTRRINASELKQIAYFLNVTTEDLFKENGYNVPDRIELAEQFDSWADSDRSMQKGSSLENMAFNSEKRLLARDTEGRILKKERDYR